MKKASRGAPVTSSSQHQVRQVVTPVRPVSSKTKQLEAQIAKLQSELDLNQYSPQNLASSNSLLQHSRRREASKEYLSQQMHQINKQIQTKSNVNRRADPSASQTPLLQTVSPITHHQRSKKQEVASHCENIILSMSNSHQRLPERQSMDRKRQSDQKNAIELSQNNLLGSFIPKQSQINHTASIQYYSNQLQRQSQSDKNQISRQELNRDEDDKSESEHLINLTAMPNTEHHKTQAKRAPNPGVSTLHDGIQYLQNNLKQLEGKYYDLAKFYTKKDRQTQSPKKRLSKKKPPQSELREQSRRKLANSQSQESLKIDKVPIEAFSSSNVYADAHIETSVFQLSSDPQHQELNQIMTLYKKYLVLKPDQMRVYQSFYEELKNLYQTQIKQTDVHVDENSALGLEYSLTEQKEVTFQVKHLSEQVRLEMKKCLNLIASLPSQAQEFKQLNEVRQCLVQNKDRLQRQQSQFQVLDKLQLNFNDWIDRMQHFQGKDQKNVVPNTTQSILESNKPCQSQDIQLQEWQEKYLKEIADLTTQNKDLISKVNHQSQELLQKSLLLTQRETQKQELVNKLQQLSLTTRDVRSIVIPDDRCRHQLETLVHLTTRFLNSMRRLQKLVHRKEPNVTAEKQEFENAKKDLEITLKTAASSLQIAAISGRQSASDTASEVPHKHNEYKESQLQTKNQPEAGKQVEENLIQQQQIDQKTEKLVESLKKDLENMRQKIVKQQEDHISDHHSKIELLRKDWQSQVQKLICDHQQQLIRKEELVVTLQETVRVQNKKIDELNAQMTLQENQAFEKTSSLAVSNQKQIEQISQLQENLQVLNMLKASKQATEEKLFQQSQNLKQKEDELAQHELQNQTQISQQAQLIEELKIIVANDKLQHENIKKQLLKKIDESEIELTRLKTQSESSMSQLQKDIEFRQTTTTKISQLTEINRSQDLQIQQLQEELQSLNLVKASKQVLQEKLDEQSQIQKNKEAEILSIRNKNNTQAKEISQLLEQINELNQVVANDKLQHEKIKQQLLKKIDESEIELTRLKNQSESSMSQLQKDIEFRQTTTTKISQLTEINRSQDLQIQQLQGELENLSQLKSSKLSLEDSLLQLQQTIQAKEAEIQSLMSTNQTQATQMTIYEEKINELKDALQNLKILHETTKMETQTKILENDIALNQHRSQSESKLNEIEYQHNEILVNLKIAHQSEKTKLELDFQNLKKNQAEEISLLQQQIAQLNDDIQARSNDQKVKQECIDKLKAENGILTQNKIQSDQHLTNLEAEVVQQQAKLQDLNTQLKTSHVQITQQTYSIKDLKLAQKKKESQTRQIEEQVESLQQQLEKSHEQLNEIQAKLQQSAQQLAESQQEKQELAKNLNESDSKFSHVTVTLTKTKLDYENQLARAQKSLSEKNQQLNNEQQTNNEQYLTIQKLRQEISDVIAQKEGLAAQAQQNTINDLQTQVESLNEDIKELKYEKVELETQVSQLIKDAENQVDYREIGDQLNKKLEERSQFILILQDQILSAQQLQIDSQAKLKQLTADYEQKCQTLSRLQTSEQQLKLQTVQLETHVSELEVQEQERLKTLENNLGLIQKLKQQLQKSLVNNQEYKDQIAEANRTKDDLQSQCNTLCAFVIEANTENNRLETTLSLAKLQIKQLQTQHEHMKKCSETTRYQILAFKQANCVIKSYIAEQIVTQEEIQKETSSKIFDVLTTNNQEHQNLARVQSQKISELERKLQDQSIKTNTSDEQQQYIQKLKQHFFQQEQHIEQLTNESELAKAQLKLDAERAQIEFEGLQIKNQSLEEQIVELKKVLDDQERDLNDKNEEIGAKNELLEEANNFIAEFNDEKHELKAKFKILMGNLNDDQSVSTYKSTDEIDLDQCFEQLEEALFKQNETQNSRILQITEERDTVNAQLSVKVNILNERDQQLKNLIQQLQIVENSVSQNSNLFQAQLQQASTKLEKQKSKLMQLKKENQQLQDQIQAQNERLKPQQLQLEDSQQSQNSLVVENAQLLERLQRTEQLLKQAREQVNISPSDQQKKTDNQASQDQEMVKFGSKLDELRKKFITGWQDISDRMLQKVEQEIVSLKMAYVQENIVCYNVLESTMIHSWNNIVEIVSACSIKDRNYLLISTGNKGLFLILESDLSEQALRYLKSFIDDQNCVVWKPHEYSEESKALRQLIEDLRQDLMELRQDYTAYRVQNKLEQLSDETLAGLLDEVEYLSGENKDLQMKVKDICLQNAQLKLQLQIAIANEQEKNDRLVMESGLIETARNISIMSDDLEEGLKEQTGFISDQDQDTFRQVVGGLSPLDTSANKKLEQAQIKINTLELKLQSKTEGNRSVVEEDDTSTTIAHIKGTLIQFLKLTPFTEKQNEELLKIIYSMMEFSSAEVNELQSSRMILKGNNKAVQQLAMQGSNSRSNTSGMSSEGEKKVKKGILGFFTKTKANTEANISGQGQMQQPPQPIKR